MLRLNVKPGETIRIGEGEQTVLITIEEKSGKAARLAFVADRSVIIRKEVQDSPGHLLRNGLSG